MVDILDAARYLVFLSYGRKKYSLTPLKLQKLLYLAQGWSYVWDDKAAFPDEFEAWQYGPVNEKVYETFRKYGRSEIPEREGNDFLRDFDVKETLAAIWNEYGKKTAYELVDLTHKQKPWRDAYSRGTKITNSSIKQYFQSTF
ncbi:type II toxin-antitoxin system antitoxin SocA domain-containing protein [Roseburia hominis]